MSAYTTCVLAVCLAGASPGTQAVKVVTTGIYDPTARLALERAAKAAVDRLERPECQKVLTDFRDASGSHDSGDTRWAWRDPAAIPRAAHLSGSARLTVP